MGMVGGVVGYSPMCVDTVCIYLCSDFKLEVYKYGSLKGKKDRGAKEAVEKLKELNLRLSVRYPVFIPLACPLPLVRFAEIFLVYCNWIP